LAVKGKVLGRKLLAQVGTVFTPDTILRWHRLLVARKWDYSDRPRKKPGRPALSREIHDLVVRFAKENRSSTAAYSECGVEDWERWRSGDPEAREQLRARAWTLRASVKRPWPG
jgi:hypothetical protein